MGKSSKRKQKEEQWQKDSKKLKKDTIEKYALKLLEYQAKKKYHKEGWGKFMQIFERCKSYDALVDNETNQGESI